jgi:hypothetical protein
MQALDAQAPGPVPYTVMIAPGGKIIYRHAGEVDFTEVMTKVVGELGAYTISHN